MITLLISDRKDGLFPSPLFGFFMPGFSNRQVQVPKKKHICGIRELMLKSLPLSNICYSFTRCILIFEKMVSHWLSIRIHTILQALNTLLGLQFTAWAFLLKGRDNFLSKSHHEVADLTKVKFGPFEGRSRKSELSQRLAGFVYDITITRQKFLSEAPKHDSDFYFAWYSAGDSKKYPKNVSLLC